MVWALFLLLFLFLLFFGGFVCRIFILFKCLILGGLNCLCCLSDAFQRCSGTVVILAQRRLALMNFSVTAAIRYPGWGGGGGGGALLVFRA